MSVLITVIIVVIVIVMMVLLFPIIAVMSVAKIDSMTKMPKSSNFACSAAASSTYDSAFPDVAVDDVSGGAVVTSDMVIATRDAWLENISNDGGYNTNVDGYSIDKLDDSYQAYLDGQVIDDRLHEQQKTWAADVAPTSQTIFAADNMDETAALGNWNGWGLRSFAIKLPKYQGDASSVMS
jgi:hypothetical protein